MLKKRLVSLTASKLSLALVLSLVVGLGAVPMQSSADDFTAAWEAADAQRKQAAKLGFQWRDTRKMLKNAKKAYEGGDADKAMKLVERAHEQANDAIAQQERESTLWQARVPK